MKKSTLFVLLIVFIPTLMNANEFYNGFNDSSFKTIVFKNDKVALYDDADCYQNSIWNHEFNFRLSDYENAQILTLFDNENFKKSFYVLKSDYCIVIYDFETNDCIFTGLSVSLNKTEGLSFPKIIFASSELTEGQKIYSAQNLLNFKSDMPWCEGVSSYGIDEKIDLRVNAKKLLIISGYVSAKRPYLFKSNSRPKKLAVYFKNSNITKEYSLEDSPNPQIIEFDETYNGDIELIIKDVYQGEKYEDTCISTVFSMYFD